MLVGRVTAMFLGLLAATYTATAAASPAARASPASCGAIRISATPLRRLE